MFRLFKLMWKIFWVTWAPDRHESQATWRIGRLKVLPCMFGLRSWALILIEYIWSNTFITSGACLFAMHLQKSSKPVHSKNGTVSEKWTRALIGPCCEELSLAETEDHRLSFGIAMPNPGFVICDMVSWANAGSMMYTPKNVVQEMRANSSKILQQSTNIWGIHSWAIIHRISCKADLTTVGTWWFWKHLML